MNTVIHHWQRRCAALTLLASCGLAGASIKTGEGFELVLTLLDHTNAKMSYTLDLGLSAESFWVQAQQDTGATFFKTIDPATDAAFNTFITQATVSTTRWMVTGAYLSAPPPDFVLFTTQTNNGIVATQTKYYDKAHEVTSNTLDQTAAWANHYTALNTSSTGGAILQSTHNTADNGSAVASKTAGNNSTYAQKSTGFGLDGGGAGDGDCLINYSFCAGNPVGTSSWFYKIKPTLLEGEVDGAEPVVIDEFDNLTADGYWGFVKDPSSSKYILSYTLAGSNPKSLISTDAGLTRLSSTDYSAESGGARLIGTAADDVANRFDVSASVSAVPEPQSWALMGLGLAGILAISRRASRNS